MNLHIRLATPSDVPRMLCLRDMALDIMIQSGNPHQWSEGYPAEATLQQDITLGQSYLVVQDEEVVGMFALADGPDPTYTKIYEGEWLDDSKPYKVLHRIASTPDSHGVFAAIIAFSMQQSSNLRIDTHRDNRIMQHLILKHGFAYCGIIYLLNGDERLAYQQI